MKDLLMSSGLSDRLDMSSSTDTFVSVSFIGDNLKPWECHGFFVSFEAGPPTDFIFSLDQQDKPIKLIGATATKVIINNGEEKVSIAGQFRLAKIEKKSRFLITLRAENYEKII